MTSIHGEELSGSTTLSRQLALVPSLAALATIVAAVVGGLLAGLDQTQTGQVLLALAVVMITLAMISGFEVTQYLGLGLLIVSGHWLAGGTAGAAPASAGQTVGEPFALANIVILVVTITLVHETGRFSLDARRPSRFGPGFISRFTANAAAVTAVVVVLALGAYFIDGRSLPPVLIPVGLAAASLPLFTRRWVQGLSLGLRSSAAVRLALGLTVVIVTLGAVAMAAQARSELVNERELPTASRPPAVAQPSGSSSRAEDEAADPVSKALTFLLLMAAVIVAGLLYAAFRRPEESYELDDLNLDIDDHSLGIAGPSSADLDDVVVDEVAMVDLLDELLLDVSSEPDPGRAVRYGYATVERRLQDLGVERQPSETEQEFLVRALPALSAVGSASSEGQGEPSLTSGEGAGSSPMAVLTDLFEAARFGNEPVTENMRAEALVAVETLRRSTSPSS